VSRRLLALVAAVAVLAVVVAAGLARLVTGDPDSVPDRATASRAAAERFLDGYVDDDGRVVRRDQGGDTVSEGQAYAMLVATAIGDEMTVEEVWNWTQMNLQRSDGLLSWQWRDGEVVDAESATDADLDAARALVLAGERFERDEWTEQGLRLGRAVLTHETVLTGDGRVLVAGTWTDEAPYAVNPSYASPAAAAVLARASGDSRWEELQDGNLKINEQLVSGDRLPPDWAQVERDGSARATGGPQGEPVRFGYDAARLPVRYAESCSPEHRALAAQLSPLLQRVEPPRTVYDLAGSPQTDESHPLAHLAQAAALAAAGNDAAARESLDAADAAQQESPTYYGAAWAALGRLMLADDALGGCSPLAVPS
jgi:endo-1,4-beta-D-glucanase Y